MKIFGIGLSKTGTSSLAAALEILGYRTRDYPGLTIYSPGDLASIDPAVLEHNEALTDTPIPSFYRELDAHYPGAKFILTVREMDGWLLSCKKQFTAKLAEKQNEAHNRLFMDLYGTAVFDEALFRAGYARFVEGVLRHFQGRPGDLLVLDVAGGDGWDKLCAFLGKPVPELPFPKANVTRIRWMDLQQLVSIAREAGDALQRAHRGVAQAADDKLLFATLVRKAVSSWSGGRPAALESATTAAQHVLTRRLRQLNAEIPVVSRVDHGMAHDERLRWNHYWIIDPLDGDDGFGMDGGEFTVNLALIEDGKPIAGVVHAPLSQTTWYAMAGRGAFQSSGDGPARRLAADTKPGTSNAPAASSSRALALCRSVDAGTGVPIGGTMIWHSAAAHALARQIGRRIEAADGSGEISYNRPTWSNPVVRAT